MVFYVLTGIVRARGQLTLTVKPSDASAADKGERLLLTEKSYEKLGAPTKGTILPEERVDEFRLAHRRYEAVRRAASILATSDNSEAMLYRKLCMRKIRREDAAFAVAYVKAKGLIREREQLDRLVMRLANEKFYGRTRIVHALCEKGYRAPDVNESIDALVTRGDLDFEEIRRALFAKKQPKDENERRKLAYTHGFFSSDEN